MDHHEEERRIVNRIADLIENRQEEYDAAPKKYIVDKAGKLLAHVEEVANRHGAGAKRVIEKYVDNVL